MKVASFTVHASATQSTRWKQVSEAEGFPSVGKCLAGAADAYLKMRAKAGLPVPLAWRSGHFLVDMEAGETKVKGYLSPPFGAFCGTPASQPKYLGGRRYTLVYVPSRRILATVASLAHCRSLASELARLWVRGDGTEPSGDPARVLS